MRPQNFVVRQTVRVGVMWSWWTCCWQWAEISIVHRKCFSATIVSSPRWLNVLLRRPIVLRHTLYIDHARRLARRLSWVLSLRLRWHDATQRLGASRADLPGGATHPWQARISQVASQAYQTGDVILTRIVLWIVASYRPVLWTRGATACVGRRLWSVRRTV